MIYDYECQKCGLMEIEHRAEEPKKTKCPTCRSSKFNRVIVGAPLTKLLGPRWARDGYGKGIDFNNPEPERLRRKE